MRPSRLRLTALRLLVDRGPLTTPELLEADATLRLGSLRHQLLEWLPAGLVDREQEPRIGRPRPAWRYRVTERGRAALAGDKA